ncbi:MAG: sugar ABC transporter permease [Anaerolineae bacterium]|nr:MAG: sugar ABC transporter permease [Anaerolineae bacterium]
MQSPYERKRFRQTSLFAYRIILPSLVFILFFIAYPLLYSFIVAFKEYKYGVPTGKIIWFQNFIDIFTKSTVAPGFYNSLVVTMKFTLVAVVAVVVISLAIALLINQQFRGSGLIKVALLLPYAIPGAVSAVIWAWIYDPSFGVMNGVLNGLGIIDEYITVAADPRWALWAILFAYVWKFVPYSTFLFAAGLATIPSSVYEAARMDRAGSIRAFFKVTLPLLRPVLQMVLVIQTIFALVMHFGLVFVITQGGPGDATRTLAWLVYVESFTFTRFGRGAAMAIILALIMIVFIYLYLVVLNPERRLKRREAP